MTQPGRQRAGKHRNGCLDQERQPGKGEAQDEHGERRMLRCWRHELRQEGEVEDRDLGIGQVGECAVDEGPAERA